MLLDTILNSKAIALLFKITRRDGGIFIPVKWYERLFLHKNGIKHIYSFEKVYLQ